MADSDERLRSIRFPQALWDAIDEDADRCKRSSVRQMEVVLSIFYGFDNSAIDIDRVRAIPGFSQQHEQGREMQILNNNGKGTEVAPRSKKPISVPNAVRKRKKTG